MAVHNRETVLLARLNHRNIKLFQKATDNRIDILDGTGFYTKFDFFLDNVYIKKKSLFSKEYEIQPILSDITIINIILADVHCNKLKYCFETPDAIRYFHITEDKTIPKMTDIKNIYSKLTKYNSVHMITKFKKKNKNLFLIIKQIIVQDRKLF